MEEAESKAVALERVADLEDELGRVNERLQELEVKKVFKSTLFYYSVVTVVRGFVLEPIGSWSFIRRKGFLMKDKDPIL